MIAIKGLPREWMFHDGPDGPELKKPWMPDVDANIPRDIRYMCEPMYIIIRYNPIQPGKDGVIEKRQILGVRIDFNNEQGRDMWEKVERYMEESVPRDERLPVPVLCAKDEHSVFETYTPRRRQGQGGRLGSLELVPSEIPMVDLTEYAKRREESAPRVLNAETIVTKETPKFYACPDCDSVFDKPRAVMMHSMKKHPKKEKVEA